MQLKNKLNIKSRYTAFLTNLIIIKNKKINSPMFFFLLIWSWQKRIFISNANGFHSLVRPTITTFLDSFCSHGFIGKIFICNLHV